MIKRVFLVHLPVAVAVLSQAASVFACAVCLSGTDHAITEGYNASVLFLMATPYVVGASIAAGLVFAYRRAVKRRDAAEENSMVELAWKQEESSR